ncbi:MAG TPA: glutathione S-transferase N-terminal domain-containing protein, partial [Casimicrobiaceae bacterium]|nr:glutathione S-transferase N-terminal domain-containing protein [Casimicrobiaceae bacterium]
MMTLYSGTTDPFSQRCRIVLHEKGMDFQIIDVDLDHKPEDLAVMNPYNQVPVLVERDLVLHESNIINEYIDERFPNPQLMPADPVMRARARLFLHGFERELFVHVQVLENSNNQKLIEKGRATIRDRLTQLAPIMLKNKYMLGEDF